MLRQGTVSDTDAGGGGQSTCRILNCLARMSHLTAFAWGAFLTSCLPFCLVPVLLVLLIIHRRYEQGLPLALLGGLACLGLLAAGRHMVLAATARAVRQTGIGRIVGESLLRHLPLLDLAAPDRLHRSALRRALRASARLIGHRRFGRDGDDGPGWLALRVRARLVQEAVAVVRTEALALADAAGIIDLTLVRNRLSGHGDRLLAEHLRLLQSLQTACDFSFLLLAAGLVTMLLLDAAGR